MIWVSGNVTVSSILFRKRAEIPSWPELFFDARFLTIFSTSVVLIHSKSKEDITLCLKKEELVLVPLYSMLFESFAPTMAKKLSKVLDISVLSSMFSPFKVKNAGKSFLSLHLFKISFIVDQVCRIFDLFLLNWSAKYCIFACLISF